MRRLVSSIAYNWRTGGPGLLARKVVGRLRKVVVDRYDSLVYRMEGLDLPRPELPAGVEVRSLDLRALLDAGYFKAVTFPGEMQQRLDRGDRCVGVFFDGALGHVTWTSVGRVPIDRGLPELHAEGVAGLYDGFTLPDFRRRGAQSFAILDQCRAAHERGATRAIGLIREHNWPSRKVFEKLGFDLIGELHYRRILRRETLEHPPL